MRNLEGFLATKDRPKNLAELKKGYARQRDALLDIRRILAMVRGRTTKREELIRACEAINNAVKHGLGERGDDDDSKHLESNRA